MKRNDMKRAIRIVRTAKFFLISCAILRAFFFAASVFAQEIPAVESEPITETAPPPVQSATGQTTTAQSTTTSPVSVQTAPARTSRQTAQRRDALLLYQNGNYVDAIAVCEAELRENPNNIESYVVMCWSLVRNRQYAEAEQRAEDGLRVGPNELRLIEIYGEAKYYLGKINGALEQFQRYVANAPESAARAGAAYYFMGEIYMRQGRFQYADIALTAAVMKEPLMDRWWTRLGYARERAENYAESLKAYDEALLLDATSVEARNGKNRVTALLQ